MSVLTAVSNIGCIIVTLAFKFLMGPNLKLSVVQLIKLDLISLLMTLAKETVIPGLLHVLFCFHRSMYI